MPDHDLRTGDWRDVLVDVAEVDAVITDPPYGARVHDSSDAIAEQTRSCTGQQTRRVLGYTAWTAADVDEFVGSWAPRCRGWMVALTSHDLVPAWERAYERAGRYAFAPVPCLARRVPRLIGDGPSSWFCYAMVARPRSVAYSRWRTLPGGYLSEPGQGESTARVGGKPLWLMRRLVEDYTRPGDLVCDPFAGGGTTAVAAHAAGRRSIGAEVDPEYAQIARDRITKATAQGNLFTPPKPKPAQIGLDLLS